MALGNPSNAGFEGLLRNDRRILIHGFSESSARASNLLAKLSAIWRGLQLAWDLDHQYIIKQSNS